MKNISQTYLKERLHYDASTGVFTWINPKRRDMRPGDVAGTVSKGYELIMIVGVKFFAHRLAWMYTYGHWPRNDIDHINGVKTDNRLINLRDIPRAQNVQNQKRAHKDSQTGIKGVSINPKTGKYVARICTNGKPLHIGSFDDMESASLARREHERLLHAHCFHTV